MTTRTHGYCTDNEDVAHRLAMATPNDLIGAALDTERAWLPTGRRCEATRQVAADDRRCCHDQQEHGIR